MTYKISQNVILQYSIVNFWTSHPLCEKFTAFAAPHVS